MGEAYALDASWQATRNIAVTAELVHQTAGPAVREAGGADVNFAMPILQFRF